MKRKNCRDAVGPATAERGSAAWIPTATTADRGAGSTPTRARTATSTGAEPLSEPETQNIREPVASRQVAVLVSNHTYSNLVLRVPGTIDQGFPHDEPMQAAVGALMASRNGYSSIPGFGLYDTTGTTEIGRSGRPGAFSYTFEIGPTEFHPPFETGVVAECMGLPPAAGAGKGGNRAAFYDALEAAATPRSTV